MKTDRLNKKILMLGCVLALGACQTTGSSTTSTQDRSARIDNAMQRASMGSNRGGQSLKVLERKYSRNSNSAEAAINYASALRQNGDVNRASIIMEPFATQSNASSASTSEFAAILLEKGDYKLALPCRRIRSAKHARRSRTRIPQGVRPLGR